MDPLSGQSTDLLVYLLKYIPVIHVEEAVKMLSKRWLEVVHRAVFSMNYLIIKPRMLLTKPIIDGGTYIPHKLNQQFLLKLLKKYKYLTYIHIELKVDESVFAYICWNFHKLQHFQMDNPITSQQLGMFALGHTKLQYMYIPDDESITDNGLSYFAAMCPNLRTLSMDYRGLTDNGIINLCSVCPKLQELYLYHNDYGHGYGVVGNYSSITDESLIAIGKHCHNLISFCLNGSAITDVGLAALAEGCPRLEYLSIDDSYGVTDKGILLLKDLPLKTLRCSYHDSNNYYDKNVQVTEEGRQALKQLIPGLEIIPEYYVREADNGLDGDSDG